MKKQFQILKKLFFTTIIIFIATFLEMYWSMDEWTGRMSSSCLECSFFKDAFFMSLMTGVFLGVLFYFISQINNKYLKIIIQFILLASIWMFWNYTVFVDRVSSWSTYLFSEEMATTVAVSFGPVLLLSSISLFIINYYNNKLKK